MAGWSLAQERLPSWSLERTLDFAGTWPVKLRQGCKPGLLPPRGKPTCPYRGAVNTQNPESKNHRNPLKNHGMHPFKHTIEANFRPLLPTSNKRSSGKRLVPTHLHPFFPLKSVQEKPFGIPWRLKMIPFDRSGFSGFCERRPNPDDPIFLPLINHIFSEKTGRNKASPVMVRVSGFIKWDLLF